MLLKRRYARNQDGSVTDPTPIGVEVLNLGATPHWHPSPDLVAMGVNQGWIVINDKQTVLTIRTDAVHVHYKILRGPGYYCCHCKEKLPGTPGTADLLLNRQRLAHVAEQHPGKTSPDPENPGGYEGISYYDCVEKNPRVKAKG